MQYFKEDVTIDPQEIIIFYRTGHLDSMVSLYYTIKGLEERYIGVPIRRVVFHDFWDLHRAIGDTSNTDFFFCDTLPRNSDLNRLLRSGNRFFIFSHKEESRHPAYKKASNVILSHLSAASQAYYFFSGKEIKAYEEGRNYTNDDVHHFVNAREFYHAEFQDAFAWVANAHLADLSDLDEVTGLVEGDVNFDVARGRVINEYNRKIVNGIVTRSWRTEFSGVVVPVSNCPVAFSSDAGQILAKGQYFSITYSDVGQSRRVELRSNSQGSDVGEIARKYGGNGSARAAGFIISRSHPDVAFS